ncbi:MAG: ABC transporter permease [Chloroflexi bacterium]|nr:ABC transporter permease [Chloroflexota bacterium]
MSANVAFQPVEESGWRTGFANVLRREHREWWRTRRWWINVLIWLAVINGIGAMMLATPTLGPDGEVAEQSEISADFAVQSALFNLVIMAGLFTVIGAIIVMQGSIIDEKKSGTAAWILSKPVSRTAFIVAKFTANAFALVVITTVIQWAVTYALFALRGHSLPVGPFVFGVALLALHLLFYTALTLALGTFFRDRGAVIAIPIVILFSAQFLIGNFPVLVSFSPWGLIFPAGADQPSVIQAMSGQPLTTFAPVIATAVLTVGLVALAIWRFRREEF